MEKESSSSDSQPDLEPSILTIFHFNDVYNIQPNQQTKFDGVCNFKTQLELQRAKYPAEKSLTLFSGDCFSPSLLSQAFKGKKMVYCLNTLGIDCACFGNHQFDLQPQQTVQRAKQCNFDWLLGNIKWRETGILLGEGKTHKIIQKNGLKIGMFGIAGSDWLGILTQDYQDQLLYIDFIQHSKKMVQILRQEQKCDIVIALTHMRNNDDKKLAQHEHGIDLILGGHQHVICFEFINKIPVIKSGCDFKNFTILKVTPKHKHSQAKYRGRRYHFDFQLITVPFHQKIDKNLASYIDQAMKQVQEYDQIIGYTEVSLETRFNKIRATQTNYGNFIADLARLYYNADACIINSGSIRNDKVIPKGPLKFSMIKDIFNDILVVKKVPGYAIISALQRSIAALPQGRVGSFLLVSGIRYSFDCQKPIGQRIISATINSRPIQSNKQYTVVMKYYVSKGGDGYDMLRQFPYTIKIPECIQTLQLIQRFFRASDIKKKQTQEYIKSVVDISKTKAVDREQNSSKAKVQIPSIKSIKNQDSNQMNKTVDQKQQEKAKQKEQNIDQNSPLDQDLLQLPRLIQRNSSVSNQYERINQLRTKVYINEKGQKFVCIAPKKDGRIKFLNNPTVETDEQQQKQIKKQ